MDVWINDVVCWQNVPRAVWDMTIGGYPVLKKWLSYRDKRVLGRALHMDEMLYITEIARRLAAVLSIAKELDDNYAGCVGDTIQIS